jgi:hypothetical protein
MSDEEEKKSSEAEDPFEVNCTKQFSTKNLRNTNTNTDGLHKIVFHQESAKYKLKNNNFSTLSLNFAPFEKMSTRGRLRSG